MKIILNNTEEFIDRDSITVSELLQLRNFTFKMIVVKVNGTLIRKPDYINTHIFDGNVVVMLHLVSGG